jgi:hypothetical protein
MIVVVIIIVVIVSVRTTVWVAVTRSALVIANAFHVEARPVARVNTVRQFAFGLRVDEIASASVATHAAVTRALVTRDALAFPNSFKFETCE